MRTAKDLAPAAHISDTEYAILNLKNSPTISSSPAMDALIVTVAPSDRWPERKRPMLQTIMKGIPIRTTSGTTGLVARDLVLLERSFSICSARACWE